jgi:hypothetical protein
MHKKHFAALGAAAIAIGAGSFFAVNAASATGTNSPAAATPAAKPPANGAYLYATTTHPIYWGCENPTSAGLVGGRFYQYGGVDATAPADRYPSCSSWAKIVVWDSHSLPESTRTSVAGLAIDGAPGDSGNGGSGGWGWNSATNKPVTVLRVGTTAGLTVTALQADPVANASITLSWDPDDFSYVGNGDTSATCGGDADAAGVETCTYTDFAHSAKGDGFQFKAMRANSAAVVTATVEANGKTATATFPVQLNAAVG